MAGNKVLSSFKGEHTCICSYEVYDKGHSGVGLLPVTIGDRGHGQAFAGLIEKACHLPAPREPRCLVRPEGDSPFAVVYT